MWKPRPHGNPRAYDLPRPLLAGRERHADFSFSGLKTAVRQLTAQNHVQTWMMSAPRFRKAVIDILCDRTDHAMAMFRAGFSRAQPTRLVVAGGVAANQAIGAGLTNLARKQRFRHPRSAPSFAPTMRR